MKDNYPKVLVFIVAYNAENHIQKVFERIPSELYNKPNLEILVIDDSSKDKTSEIATKWVKSKKIKNITILRNEVNQRYGGNQKLGYLYAILNNFDFVILLHGDGQYAPELLPLFIDTYKLKKSDVVLGSRMVNRKEAAKGGMPLYKQIGNTILTTFQNWVTSQNVSEYHTGYRGYSTDFLRSIPFQLNTNEFHFDTDILLQAFYVNAKISEFSIPTYYGDEVCHVNGFQYAWDVVISTLQYRFHKMGIFCSLKFQSTDEIKYFDKSYSLYPAESQALEWIVEMNPKSILYVGSGTGKVTKQLKEKGINVTGIDSFPPLVNSVNSFIKFEIGKFPIHVNPDEFQAILLLDVLELLESPEEFLLDLRNRSEFSHFKIILSTPNVAFFSVRLNLLFGRFNYASRGILDIRHKRLFTRNSLISLLENCGYRLLNVKSIGAPFEIVMPGFFGKIFGTISSFLARILPSLFAFQFLVLAEPTPGVGTILKKAKYYIGKKVS